MGCPCNTSTRAQRVTPVHKSCDRSATLRFGGRCSFTQFLKVFACISTHTSSFPLICMPLAACPSGDRARSPLWDIFASMSCTNLTEPATFGGLLVHDWKPAHCTCKAVNTTAPRKLSSIAVEQSVVTTQLFCTEDITCRCLSLHCQRVFRSLKYFTQQWVKHVSVSKSAQIVFQRRGCVRKLLVYGNSSRGKQFWYKKPRRFLKGTPPTHL